MHFEISIESFRTQAAAALGAADLQVVDTRSGRLVFDAAHPQPEGSRLGEPASAWSRAALAAGAARGAVQAHGRRAAYAHLARTAHNANDWTVVAVARHPLPAGLSAIGFGPIGLLVGALLLLAGVAVVAVFSRDVARRASGFAAVAERLGRGDLSETVPEGRDDELGALARTLNHVVETYLRRLAAAAQRIAGGDLGATVEPVSEDDTLGHAFAAMADGLSSTVGEVRRAATRVGSASRDIAGGTGESSRAVGEVALAVGDVAQVAEEQVRLLEQARVDAGDAAREAAESADSAEQARELAGKAAATARRGADAAGRAGTAMDGVRDSSAAAATGVQALADALRAHRRDRRHDLGHRRADQPARAQRRHRGRPRRRAGPRLRRRRRGGPQARRGVPARRGRDRRADRRVQADTRGVVEVVEQSARRTAEGIATVDEARDALGRLESDVELVNDRVAAMASATERIAARLSGIETGVREAADLAERTSAASEEMSASTEQTSATSEQLAASAQEMAATADELERAIGRFTVALD